MAGMLLLAVGLDKFFGFYPLPMGTDEARAFVAALEKTGYMMPLVAAVETLCGLCFLSGRYVALAAVVVAPVSVNAFLFHLFLSPMAMIPTTLLFVLNLLLLIQERRCYQKMFKP
jgi:uncharacterized membrane protein YphA (DoxX/SURF4 family)